MERFFYVLPLNVPSNRRCLYISRNNRGSLPLRGGRWREATDEGGRTALTFCYAAFKRTLKCIGTAEKSLPPGGEGGALAPDEGEIGERTHVTQPPPRHPNRAKVAGRRFFQKKTVDKLEKVCYDKGKEIPVMALFT